MSQLRHFCLPWRLLLMLCKTLYPSDQTVTHLLCLNLRRTVYPLLLCVPSSATS